MQSASESLNCMSTYGNDLFSTTLATVLIGSLYISCLLLIWKWRPGVFGIVLWEALRDPVRKLLPDYVVTLAIAGCLLWVACLLGCLRCECRRCSQVVPKQFYVPIVLLFTFLSLGIMAGWQHGVPIRVLGLGFVSYVFPFIGLITGYHFGKQADSVRKLLALYAAFNALLIGATFLEILGVKSPVLGGILMEWYRFRGTHSIPLPSGFYRSPDILGLHAAHVFAFSLLLTITAATPRWRILWLAMMYWGGVMLMISARRKMQGLAVVFLGVFFGLLVYHHKRLILPSNRFLPFRRVALISVLCGFCMLACWATIPSQVVYAASIIYESPARIAAAVFSSPSVTLRQSGVAGIGLGTATQGNSIVGNGYISGWQEDGLSRLVLEGGLGGAICMIVAIAILAMNGLRIVIRADTDAVKQQTALFVLAAGLLSIITGNLACYSISHQHFSGDPLFGALLGLWMGCLWSNVKKPQKDEL